jgi:hypothetical protein
MPSPTKPTVSTAYATVLSDLKALLPTSYIGGLILSNDAGDTDHDVNVTAGEARDATDVESLRLATEITKQINAAWAVGDDAGGLDAGAVAADTLYAVWLIMRSDTGVVDALISTSFTAPTMPTDYDYKRLIGAVMTNGASNVIQFTQVDNYFRYTGDVLSDVADATITDDTFEVGTLSVPPSCMAHVYASLSNPTTTSKVTGYLYLRTNGAADAAIAAERWSQLAADALFDETGCIGQVLVDSSSQVQYAAKEVDGAATVSISTLGFWMLTRSEPV